MAFLTKIISATSGSALAVAVNAYLAGLTNPTVRRLDVTYDDAPSTTGGEWSCTIDHTDSGAALATPFLISVQEKRTTTDLQTAVQTLLTDNPTYFFAGTRYIVRPAARGRLQKAIGVLIYNTTAGSSANWVMR